MSGGMDMIRPEHLLKLPMLNEETKKTYSEGLTKLWDVIERLPKESEQHQQALAKIKAVSKDIMLRISTWKATGNVAQRPQSQAGVQPRPPTQQGLQQGNQSMAPQTNLSQQQQPNQQLQMQMQMQQGQPSQVQQPQQQQQQQQVQPQQGQGQQPQQPPMSNNAKAFIAGFQVYPPAEIQPNSPNWEPYKNRILHALTQAVMTQEQHSNRYTGLDTRIKQLEANGQQPAQDIVQAREKSKQVAQVAKQRIEALRNDNAKHRMYWQGEQARKQQANSGNAQQQQQQQQVNVGAPGQMSNQPVPQIAPQQQMQSQIAQGQQPQQQLQNQQLTQQQPQPQTQQTQSRPPQMPNTGHVFAASPVGNNTPNTAQNTMSPAVSGPFGTQNMPAQVNQQVQQGQQQPFINQQGQQMGGSRPQPIPQQQNFQAPANQQGQPGPGGVPQPLSHQEAITQANHTYSQTNIAKSQQNTPSETPPYAQIPSTQNTISVNQKIPRTLVVNPVTPVPMAPARPTFGGASNGAPGMMGQPAIAKQPGFILEGEGDRVLSKKKLDELVRQVTGGGEGDGLTPEVEEVRPSTPFNPSIHPSIHDFPSRHQPQKLTISPPGRPQSRRRFRR